MRLNHINLCTSDVAALSDFLVVHFDYAVISAGKTPKGTGVTDDGLDYAMLDGADGSSLVLTQIAPTGAMPYPSDFHFGIAMDAPDEVHAKYRELVDAGHAPEEVKNFEAVGASWTTFLCPLGDNMKIEVNHRSRAVAARG